MSDHKISERFTFGELTEESTPLRIMHSTLEEISTNGLSGLTTKGISQRANLSTGIIHHYFDTKDNLVYAAYVYLVRDLHQSSLAIFRAESDPKKRLQAMIRMNFSSVHISPEARDVWPQFWAQAAHEARAARLLRVYYRRFQSNLAHDFRALLGDRAKAQAAANLLLASIHGVWFIHRFSDSPKHLEESIALVEQNLELLLKPA
ncbi:transcriptional regulator BetI [Thiothrix eikelboomii]|uniref:Transcriptional regulator, TetR family n=1 Tax=Thiothrix eikelboomii TaxID=92487 RepID=A0A1T4W9B4_9GAMM|nr:transcriptional regulator BetI [Thiothrix eikelboomii]SKA73866.1 transcriptional regulator, TetR family [Thiothrix eikelboomii]